MIFGAGKVLLLLVIYFHNFHHSVATNGWWFGQKMKLSSKRLDYFQTKNHRNFSFLFRGGGDDGKEDEDKVPEEPAKDTNTVILDDDESSPEGKTIETEEEEEESSPSTQEEQKDEEKPQQKTVKSRHTYDMIVDLRRRSSVHGNDESLALRQLITARSKDYIRDLREALDIGNDNKLPHPRKLLHFLAPKVPAIKQSPDVNLRIYSARSDMDSGVAACIIGTLARVSEIYDKETMKRSDDLSGKSSSSPSVASEIIKDRRFEQLVECVLSGVNVEKRKKESLMRRLDKNSEETDIEQILDEEDAQEDEGLNIRDVCRAAWGISILGCSHLDTLGDVKVLDLLLALSLRVRELLLARLQLLRQEDLFSDPSTAHLSTEEVLDDLAEELAEDAATAMWTFACVKACTGMRSVPLFETCSSILCQDPVDMRKRAQAADYEAGVPIGTNDIVDRLARSEIDDKPDPVTEKGVESGDISEKETEEKDALLDWLSPTEVNDILWALALHGSSNSNATSASDEVMLSETASALREIAFDRMFEWLEQDLTSSSDDSKLDTEFSTAKNDDNAVTVEVVDAATLLAAQRESISDPSELPIEALPVETMALKASGSVQEVEVVNAAALLASMEEGNEGQVETEVISASPITESSTELQSNESTQSSDETLSDENDSSAVSSIKQKTIFSPHDLASIAWSVTELRDPLRVRVVGMVVRLIEKRGITGTASLTGGDLANVAWAISKYEDKLSEKEPNRPDSLSTSVLSWIAHNAYKKILMKNKHKESDSGGSSPMLHLFQPPEIGRLIWAIANTMSTYSEVPHQVKRNKEIMELARLSLETAAFHLSLFATEDLLRVSWAFLEICGEEESMIDSSVANALGSILTTVEQSLHRWERGDCQRVISSSSQADTSLFSSFFGKPRIHHQLPEHLEGDLDDDDESVLAPLLAKSKRPLLKDLTVDPSTLCKAACAFQRLSKKHPYMKGGWTLTRVAVRLLSSKDARLMKECSIHDIARLCEATVLSEADGHGRELITGLFARKVLQVLNSALDFELDQKVDSSIDLTAASPPEKCSLLLSLGQLGAKHYLSDDAKHSAYKKMRLVSNAPLLSKHEIQSLDLSSILKLLRGIVLMNFLSSDKNFLLLVVKDVREKVRSLHSSSDLCTLAESVAVLKEGSKPRNKNDAKKSDKDESAIHDEASTTANDATDASNKEVTDQEDKDSSSLLEETLPVDDASVEDELQYLCDELLDFVASRARERVTAFSTEETRRLLAVYSLLPFQADDLINDLSEEVEHRLSHLQRSPDGSFESLLRNTRSKTVSVNTTLFGDEGSDSPFSIIKNGILSFFHAADDSEKKEENNLTEELASMIRESTAIASKAADRAEELRSASGVSLDSLVQNLKQGAAFELGRCNELIENYRRIEFSTGKQRSRYDRERTKDIAKRVLSRLLP